MFARAVGRTVRVSTGVTVTKGTCHPPLAAHIAKPRDWKEDPEIKSHEDEKLPLFLFCHATGFCKEVWNPVVDHLSKLARQPFRWLALDFAGHGDSRPLPSKPAPWDFAKEDVLTVLKELGDGSNVVVGVGHSMGGAACLLAELELPSTFKQLVLFEPIVMPEPAWLLKHHQLNPQQLDAHLSKLALRRRNAWSSKEEALAYMQSRNAFHRFDERSMHAYVTNATRHTPDATGVELKCAPHVEAAVYPGRPGDLFGRVSNVTCPTTLLSGGLSPKPLDASYFEALALNIPHAQHHSAAQCGHFLVMEDPLWCAAAIGSACKELLPELFGPPRQPRPRL